LRNPTTGTTACCARAATGHVAALLDFVYDNDLVGSVDPVQYSVRLLLPRGSLLLGHPDLIPFVGEWDDERSTFTWEHPDPAIDELQRVLATIAEQDGDVIELYALVRAAAGASPVDLAGVTTGGPRLSESWFCCAEPTELQLRSVS
jgi:hypothetical protein